MEFKAVPFYRENIAQILEYKARVISEYTNDNSILKDIFEDKLFSPIMILVVPNCSAEARLACNLSGIEIYKSDKSVPQLLLPEKKITLEHLKHKFNSKDIPITGEYFTVLNHLLDSVAIEYIFNNEESLLDFIRKISLTIQKRE